MIPQLRSLMLPLAMLAGFLFSGFFGRLVFLAPYLIFSMLLITFCRITPREMKFTPLHFILLAIQLLVSIAVYFAVRPADETAAQGIMICILAPTATSAVIIAGMLGANLASMATFTLLSNVATAVAAPLIFSYIGTHADMPFIQSFFIIMVRVVPVLVLPFVSAFLLMKLLPRFHEKIARIQIVSFYMWSFALMIVTGKTVDYLLEHRSENLQLEIQIAIVTFVVCIVQFVLGRALGRRFGDTVAGGQSLGQKNTILAIWMAQTYLNPVASIGPASYVLWQNLVNSWQLWRQRSLPANGNITSGDTKGRRAHSN